MKPEINERRKQELKALFDYSLTVLLFGFSIFLLIGLFFYSVPRNFTNLDLVLEKGQIFRAGQTVEYEAEFESFVYANSTYDQRVVCRNGREQRVYLKTIEVSTTPREKGVSTPTFIVPERITGHNCVLQITAVNCSEILPFMTKCITEIAETNSFGITE